MTAEASEPAKPIVVPAGGGQASLRAAIVGNELVYRACEAEPCPDASKEERIQVGDGAEVSLEALAIGQGRHVLRAHGPGFDAFVAAVPGEPHAAKLLWSGPTGLGDGDPGERRGALVRITEPAADGTVSLLVGDQREDVSICGRETMLAARWLDPKDLSWKPAKAPRFSRQEREAASKLVAKRRNGAAPTSLVPVLRARIATSAVGDPGALTDGDLETTWAEGRKGEGRGELVQLDVARDVPVTGLSFVVRPPKKAVPKGAAPSRFWLATSDRLFSVSLPDDAWSKPGAAFEIAFDEPLETPCLTIVLDEASAHARPDAEVGFAEVIAHTPYDDAIAPALLVQLLNGGGAQSKAARAILQEWGEPAFLATAERYLDLDEPGRALALEVLDVGPCSISAPVYLDAAVSTSEGQAHHGRDRLARCGREAAPALTSVLAKGPDAKRVVAAQTLSLGAPDLAVGAILDALPQVTGKTRLELRSALARSAAAPRAEEATLARLRDAEAPAESTLSLLRSLSPRPALLADASAAYERLSASQDDFRSRYLLLEPAARLAREGASQPLGSLREALTGSEDRHLRVRAAEVAAHVPALAAELLAATNDPEPRVREAAIVALGRQASVGGGTSAVDAIVSRMQADPWTFVRAEAADALASFPASPAADAALGAALSDATPHVRGRAVEAIGKRRAVSQVSRVRERLDDSKEALDVRVRAARALGDLCDSASVEKLVKLVREGSVPMATGDAQRLAMASIAALGRLQPKDLREKLAPLLGEGAPRLLAIAAKAALDRKDGCRQ